MSNSTAVHDPRTGPNRASSSNVESHQDQENADDMCALIVELEGLPYEYAFNETDLFDIFSRYGEVKTVQFLDSTIAPDIALVEFRNSADGTNALNTLNGYSFPFDGFQVVLSVNYYDEIIDKEIQSKLRIAAAISLSLNGPQALLTGSKYTARGPSADGWQCRFVIGAEKMEREFPIVGRIIGPQGSYVKSIYEQTGARLRLRGRRSNFKEGPEGKETDDPLHLCVSASDESSFMRACEQVESLMGGVYGDYSQWCERNRIPVPNIQLICVDGPFSEPLEWKLRDFYASQANRI